MLQLDLKKPHCYATAHLLIPYKYQLIKNLQQFNNTAHAKKSYPVSNSNILPGNRQMNQKVTGRCKVVTDFAYIPEKVILSSTAA